MTKNIDTNVNEQAKINVVDNLEIYEAKREEAAIASGYTVGELNDQFKIHYGKSLREIINTPPKEGIELLQKETPLKYGEVSALEDLNHWSKAAQQWEIVCQKETERQQGKLYFDSQAEAAAVYECLKEDFRTSELFGLAVVALIDMAPRKAKEDFKAAIKGSFVNVAPQEKACEGLPDDSAGILQEMLNLSDQSMYDIYECCPRS